MDKVKLLGLYTWVLVTLFLILTNNQVNVLKITATTPKHQPNILTSFLGAEDE